MKKLTLILVFILISVVKFFSQSDSVKYDLMFQFSDGLYLNFEQLKNNSPINFSQIYDFTFTENDLSYFDNAEQIRYYDDFGNLITLNKTDIWGYCVSGHPYVFYASKFNMLSNIGKISFFVSTILIRRYVEDPMIMTSYGHFVPGMGYESYVEEVQSFIINWEDGNIYKYSAESLVPILKNDNELFTEYDKLSRRKKDKEKYNYILRYNEKHPIYFLKK